METSPETRYLITGADGKEYGPVNGDDLRKWVREGRANASTRARVENTEDYRTLGEFPEFADLFEAPAFAPGSLMPDSGTEDALQKVQAPAIGLLITAIIGLLAAGTSLMANILGIGMGAAGARGDEMEQVMQMMSGTMGIVLNLIGLGVGVLTLVASLKMKKLESYGLVMTATICSMVPCISPCCCVGLPIGVWVLIVLAKPEVKSAFR